MHHLQRPDTAVAPGSRHAPCTSPQCGPLRGQGRGGQLDVGEANCWPTSGGRSDRRSAECTLATQKAAAAAIGLGGRVGPRV